MRKAEVSVQTFFLILMVIFMVWIIYFGFTSLFSLSDEVLEHERIVLREEVSDFFAYCEDPLNSGNTRILERDFAGINSIAVFSNGGEIPDNTPDDLVYDFEMILEGGDNVVFLSTFFIREGLDSYSLSSYVIIDSFRIESFIDKPMGVFDYENLGVLSIRRTC